MPLYKRVIGDRTRRCSRWPERPAAALWVALSGLTTGTMLPAAAFATPAEPTLRVVAEHPTYNPGDEVWLKIIPPAPQGLRSLDSYLFTVRYAGEQKPLWEGAILKPDASRLGVNPTELIRHRPLWKIPLDARAGRYEIDLQVQDPRTHRVMQDLPHVCSFVVHRQIVRIGSMETSETYFTAGDAVGCRLEIENLGERPLAGLRLEFSERYWPWIAQQKERVGTDIETLASDMKLEPHRPSTLSFPHCAEAKGGSEPTIKQYGAVVWDHDRKNVYAISFSPVVFVNPPGKMAPRPYPAWFIYPALKAVNTRSYRAFAPQPFGGDAIQFDTHHTMFPAGSEAAISFSLKNPTEVPWRQVSVRARLLGPGQKEQSQQVVVERVDLDPHIQSRNEEAKFDLPAGLGGVYRAVVEVTDASGLVLAANLVELGVNPLPKSVLLFCAHEDDDGTQMGFVRALVENHIPLHVIYFTSGDSGSCDRYYEHPCGSVEALNFGALRMEESRAALGHLGVPREDILFLGLPDGGSGKIWYDHPRSSDPYLAVLLASDHSPYEGLFRANLPYAREAVVEATAEIIQKFQPEVIFTAHPPAEGHIDHIVCNYFVVKALEGLVSQNVISSQVELRVDRIFDLLEHPATPYHYEDHTFYVSGSAMALAQEAGWYYQSQGGNRGEGNLRTWNQLPRSEGYRKVLDWKEHAGWNDKE